MKKSFWMRLIIFVAVFMITINGILPTNVVFADNADPNSSSATKESDDDTASAFERIICGLLLTLGTSVYLLVRLVIGQPFSIDKAIFNEYSNTKLSFFDSDVKLYGQNDFLESGNIRPILNKFFEAFRGIAILIYLIILVYMGIRILLGSTAEKGSRHKELMVYWLQGVVMLFVFPFIMKYAIHINNSFVSFVGENRNRFIATELNGKNVNDSEMEEVISNEGMKGFTKLIDATTAWLIGNKDTDYMAYMYSMALEKGWVVYVVCWFVMFLQMIGFLVVYFKRVLVVMFLIAIFPLVMISYAIDKVGDGKSQAFDNWLKEYLLNIFVQSFHAIAYVLIMSVVSCLGDNPKEYWLVMLIAISFISKGDDILRAIFSLGSSQGTVKGIGASLGQVAVAKTVASGIKSVGQKTFGSKSYARRIFNSFQKVSDKSWEMRANRAEEQSNRIALGIIPAPKQPPVILADRSQQEIKDDIKNAMDIALKKKNSTAEEFQDALDKLIAYRNQTGNSNVQNALDEATQGLTNEEASALEELLKQNAMINAMMTTGVDVNFTQNVNLLLASLKRDKNGNLTPESQKMLKKLAISEKELKEMASYSEIKFKEDKSQRVSGGKTRVADNDYWTNRRARNGARGRGAAKRNRAENNLSDASTVFEATRNRNMSQVGTNKKIPMTETEKQKLREQRRRKRNARTAMYKAGQPTIPKTIKQEEKKIYENVVDRNGVTSGVGKGKVVINKSANLTTKNMTARRTLKGFSNATVANTVKYGGGATTQTATSSSTTTTSYASAIPQKSKINTSVSNGAMTKREREVAIKEAIANAQNSSRTSKKKYSQRKQSLLSRKYDNNGKENNTTNIGNTSNINNVLSGKQAPVARGTSSSRQNPGATIAGANGNADDLQDIINNIEMTSKETVSNLSNSERIVREQKNVDADVEILKDSVNAINNMASGHYTIDEIIMETETIKTLTDDYKNESSIGHKDIADAIKGAKYNADELQSDMLRLKEIAEMKKTASSGEYTAKELLANAKELESLIQKYRNGTQEEKKFARIMEDYAGCSPESYEMMLRVKILNNPDSVNNDRTIIEECKTYVKENAMSDFIRSRLNYNVDDLREGVNVKYLKSNGNDDSQITSSIEQQRYREAIERSRYEREINKLDTDYDKLKKEKKQETIGAVVTSADTITEAVFSTLGGAAIGSTILGMSADGKKDLIATMPEKVLTSYTIGSDLTEGTVQNVINVRNKGIEYGEKGIDFIKKTVKGPANENTEEYVPASTQDYKQRLSELANKTKLEGESFAERKARMSGNNNSNNI